MFGKIRLFRFTSSGRKIWPRMSSAVLLTSRGEGFGLPAIEAAHYRRWALVRKLPVFAEQQLPNLFYFSDDSPIALARNVVELLQHAKAGEPPISEMAGWSRCVDELIGAMNMEERGALSPAVETTVRGGHARLPSCSQSLPQPSRCGAPLSKRRCSCPARDR